MPAKDPSSATNGLPYILEREQPGGDWGRHLQYLAPDGRRRGVVVHSAHDSDEVRDAIGRAVANGRRVYNPERSAWSPGDAP